MNTENIELASLVKICNEALILSILRDGPRHGYQIALEIDKKSNSMFQFNHGTLYPILHKLEKRGLIRGKWKVVAGERKRKYYTLTSRGGTYLDNQNSDLKSLFDMLLSITGGS